MKAMKTKRKANKAQEDEALDEEEDEDAQAEEEDSGSGEEARASVAPSTKSTRSAGLRKRSVSVMSTPSEKSTKRQKK